MGDLMIVASSQEPEVLVFSGNASNYSACEFTLRLYPVTKHQDTMFPLAKGKGQV